MLRAPNREGEGEGEGENDDQQKSKDRKKYQSCRIYLFKIL
jgi:hypothetical protein